MFQIDQEDLSNEADRKKACLLSSMEAVSPSEKIIDVPHDKDPSNDFKDCPVNENGEHRDAAASAVPQIHPARFYSN